MNNNNLFFRLLMDIACKPPCIQEARAPIGFTIGLFVILFSLSLCQEDMEFSITNNKLSRIITNVSIKIYFVIIQYV